MHRYLRLSFAMLLMGSVLLVLALLYGITPDSLLYGHWNDPGDHPTNWTDPVLHPW